MRNITLTGQTTRYQMKRVIDPNKSKTIPRKDYAEWLFLYPEVSSPEAWMQTLVCIRDGTEYVQPHVTRIIKSEIKNKVAGYQAQDKLKGYDPTIYKPISEETCIALIIRQDITCIYCNIKCLIIYPTQRHLSQWTLDRIDNTVGHTLENVVICCLGCNLQRRNTSVDKFKSTKQLLLVKSENT